MTQSHANCTGNTGKQRGAEAGVNRFTKTMNGCKTQAAKESQTSQTFPLTKTAAAFILPRLPVVTRVHKQWIVFFFCFLHFFLHPVCYLLAGHTAAATVNALTPGGGDHPLATAPMIYASDCQKCVDGIN